ncbi:MAG: phosphoribosylanthranilate isomerase [Planctomycetes bacterium]|nr:phosphoribosylanthranilate isomerase [Planctomycetota bacterium]
MSPPRVKICGVTNLRDARAAAAAGADYIGLVFARSPRQVAFHRARRICREVPRKASCVGVFVDEPPLHVAACVAALNLDAIQLHGRESPEECRWLRRATGRPVIKAFRFSGRAPAADLLREYRRAGVRHLLLDARPDPDREALAGRGRLAAWRLARRWSRAGWKVFVAGGLHAGNAGEAMSIARPFAVDAASTLERRPGRKDPEKVKAFVLAARSRPPIR